MSAATDGDPIVKLSDKVEKVSAYLAAYNAFDVNGMTAVVSDDVVFQNIAAGEVTHETRGLPAFRALAEKGAEMFSCREQQIVSLSETGEIGSDVLSVEVRFRGTVKAEAETERGKGQVIEVRGQSEFRFRNDRIVSIVDQS